MHFGCFLPWQLQNLGPILEILFYFELKAYHLKKSSTRDVLSTLVHFVSLVIQFEFEEFTSFLFTIIWKSWSNLICLFSISKGLCRKLLLGPAAKQLIKKLTFRCIFHQFFSVFPNKSFVHLNSEAKVVPQSSVAKTWPSLSRTICILALLGWNNKKPQYWLSIKP